MLSTLQIILITIIAAAAFLILSSTKFGIMLNTVIFTVLLLIVLVGVKLAAEKQKLT